MDAIKKPANRPSLEGVTLEMIVTHLSESMGWEAMAAAVPVRCFTHDPSIKSHLEVFTQDALGEGEGGAVVFVAGAQVKATPAIR